MAEGLGVRGVVGEGWVQGLFFRVRGVGFKVGVRRVYDAWFRVRGSVLGTLVFGMFFEPFADTGAKERGPELGPSLIKLVSPNTGRQSHAIRGMQKLKMRLY